MPQSSAVINEETTNMNHLLPGFEQGREEIRDEINRSDWQSQAKRSVVITRGREEASPDQKLADALQAALAGNKISPRDVGFAQSLLSGFDKYHSFTPKQRPHVERLVQFATAAKALVEHLGPPTGELDLSKIPSGRYAIEHRRYDIRQGSNKWEGWTFVDDGSEYGVNAKLARQAPSGIVTIQQQRIRVVIHNDLVAIAANPLEASKQFGRINGVCGVCGRHLENPESVAAGIGPICAGRFA